MSLAAQVLLAVGLLGRLSAAADCARCHAAESKAFANTAMAGAMQPAASCEILLTHPKLVYRDSGYTWTIASEKGQSLYTVTGPGGTFSVPIEWAFGLGNAGQTYVFRSEGKFFESRISYYRETGALDFTLGVDRSLTPRTPIEAAGREMTGRDAARCFGCHSSGGIQDNTVHLESMHAGVACESCHPGAQSHASALTPAPKLSTQTAEEMSEACGACHRTWADIASNGPQGVLNVRFQAYRLANSRCYDALDRRIRCTACHDPHSQIETRASVYDSRCLACHSGGESHNAKTVAKCRVASASCVNCHMPKIEIPGSHHRFSDHQIRIVRNNERYPN